mmetsp:Transcript_23248/g.38970  ORF Transcript_23248/g.38970 Transcript_23248/m.38970 type:complete len:626 (-) Transcript_23248:9-1886(-)
MAHRASSRRYIDPRRDDRASILADACWRNAFSLYPCALSTSFTHITNATTLIGINPSMRHFLHSAPTKVVEKMSSSRRVIEYTSSNPSALEVLHKKELAKIHELWNGTKDELAKVTRQVNGLERERAAILAQRDAEYKDALTSLQLLSLELKDRVHFLENKLRGKEIECEGAHSDVESLSVRIEEMQRVITDKDSYIRDLENSLSRVRHETTDVHAQLSFLERKSEETIKKQNEELESKKEEIIAREIAIEKLQLDCENLVGMRRRADNEISSLQEKIQAVSAINSKLRTQLDAAQEKNATLAALQQREKLLQDENRQAKTDCERMVALLRNSEEYKRLLFHFEDSNGDVRFVDEVKGFAAIYPSMDDKPIELGTEELGWVPGKTVDLMQRFRSKWAPNVPMEVVHDLIHQLNSVWRDRETRRIARLKKGFAEDTADLRRKLQQRMPYQDVIKLQDFERLKKTVQSERQQGKGPTRAQKDKLLESEERLLQNALATVESLNHQVQKLEGDNQDLQARLVKVTQTRASASFMDGVAWMAQKVSDRTNRLGFAVASHLKRFEEELVEAARGGDPSVYLQVTSVSSSFVDSMTQLMLRHRGKIRQMFDAATLVHADRSFDLSAFSDSD